MQRSWMLGGVIGLLLASTLWGRPGIVKTRDGQTVTGDVTELPDEIIVDIGGIHSTIDRDNIRSIAYSDTVEQECRKRLARLTAYDVAGRVELAQWLFENKAYAMARTVLSDAAAIQPKNADVIEMMRTVDRQILLEQSQERKHAPVQLAAAGDAPPAGAMPAGNGGATGASRLVTPEEINLIRQDEWQKGETVRVTFKDDVPKVHRQGRNRSGDVQSNDPAATGLGHPSGRDAGHEEASHTCDRPAGAGDVQAGAAIADLYRLRELPYCRQGTG